MNITSAVPRVALALAAGAVCMLVNAGIFLGSLAAMQGADAAINSAIDQCVEEIDKSAAQTNDCVARVKETTELVNRLADRLETDANTGANKQLTSSLESCVSDLQSAVAVINDGTEKIRDDAAMLEDDLDKFVEIEETMTECVDLLPRENALRLAMIDHLNQFGLPNLTFEADGLEWDGENQLLMNNCAYASDEDECQPMAMQVTMHDNGTFMLGDPQPLEQ